VEGGRNGTSISASGLLSVGANETAATLTVRATSTADPSKYGTAIVTVYASENELPTVSSVTVTPATATVAKGAAQQFTAAVSGTNNPAQSVTWTVEGGGDGTSISTGGLLSIGANETATALTVRAASTDDPSKSGTATVTVSSGGQTSTVTSVTVNPATTTVTKGGTRQFTAVVNGNNTPAQTVTWTVEGGGNGTGIGTDGLLSVASNESASTLTVRAASTVDPGKSGTASVTVQAEALHDIASIYAYLSAASGGAITAIPVSLNVQLNLDNTSLWSNLMDVIQVVDKFVALDLSACTISGTEFDPGTATTGKNKIVSLVLPNGATSIEGTSDSPSFKDFSVLASVSGSAVERIGPYAFYNCTTLRTVSLPATLKTISSGLFRGCTNLATITVASGNPYYKGEKGMLLNKAGTMLFAYPSAAGAVTLNTVTSIFAEAFSGCDALTTVSLPAATSIGPYAFYNCTSLTTVSLPVATSIGHDAFSSTGTSALTVTLGSAAPTLGNSMFDYVYDAKAVTVKVPSNATGYGTLGATYSDSDSTETWGNGFRGRGWDGAAFTGGSINSSITLTIQAE
jgi:hypothetical protein